jgi:ABC-2 type transport system permease protein
MNMLRAWLVLVSLSFRRLVWSMNTLMVLFPIALGTAVMLAFRLRRGDHSAAQEFVRLTDFLLTIFSSFIVPVVALAYGTTSIGGDREDRTLLFLLVRPIPRPLILLAKFSATLPLVIGIVVGSYYGYCRMAGPVGERVFNLFLPPVFLSAVAYVGLFHLFAVAFRHSTIIALIYALFMEIILGNMPGIVKQVAVNYYGRSMIYELGALEGLQPPDPGWFAPVTSHTAGWMLIGIAVGGMLLALAVFQRREYRDLT